MLKFIVKTRKVLGSEHLAVPFRLEAPLDIGATHIIMPREGAN